MHLSVSIKPHLCQHCVFCFVNKSSLGVSVLPVLVPLEELARRSKVATVHVAVSSNTEHRQPWHILPNERPHHVHLDEQERAGGKGKGKPLQPLCCKISMEMSRWRAYTPDTNPYMIREGDRMSALMITQLNKIK